MPDASRPPRSGCAVLFGVFLIGVGSLALAHQLLGFMGVSPVRVGARALDWFGTYWPVLLVGWGIYKVYVRFNHPERAHVSAAEIVILVWILVAGLAVRGVQRAMDELSVHVSPDDVASVFGSDLLGPPHRSVETRTFDIEGAASLTIENLRGQVSITGSDDTAIEVTLTKQMHSFSESDAQEALSRVELEFHGGDEARLETSAPDRSPSLVTDLEIKVPRALVLTVSNRRGAIFVRGIDRRTTLDTSHGNVEASDLADGLYASTSHGTMVLEKIAGPVVATNEHGVVRAASIDGDVSVSADHSSITVEDVTGNATLETQQGSVRATGVAGTVAIESPYSEVSVESAGQSVRVASSHRPVYVHDVGGELEVVARYARIMIRGVTGGVTVENLNRPVSVTDVDGSVSVSGDKCAVDIDSILGSVTIATSYEDISVSELVSALDVRASNADVAVRARRIDAGIRVETSRGDVRFDLPRDASARITARTRRGEIITELSGVSRMASTGVVAEHWEGLLGEGSLREGSLAEGTHPLTIVTSDGDIVLREADSK